jgi:thiamine pyrophosphokinase
LCFDIDYDTIADKYEHLLKMTGQKAQHMRIVIFAGGDIQPGKAVDEALASANMVIAADSGAESALRYGLIPAFVVGDFDSIDPQIREKLQVKGSQFLPVRAEKDETDTELAMQYALDQGATEITLLGALGGSRFDHTLANILLLAGYDSPPMRIVDGASVGWPLKGPGAATIDGKPGDLLSLLPLTADAEGVSTEGLYYPLRGEILRFGKPRGMSNVLTGERARVSLEHGLLLVIHTTAANP